MPVGVVLRDALLRARCAAAAISYLYALAGPHLPLTARDVAAFGLALHSSVLEITATCSRTYARIYLEPRRVPSDNVLGCARVPPALAVFYHYDMVHGMAVTIPIDKAGRLVLPKELRERFRLRPGSRLAIEVKGDHLLLRPVEQEPVLVQEGGWWVYRGGTTDPDELVDAVQRHREDRLVDLSR